MRTLCSITSGGPTDIFLFKPPRLSRFTIKMANARFYFESQLLLDLPQRICCFGGAGSGKTYLTRNLIKYADEIFSSKFDEVVFVYSEYQMIYKEMETELGVEFYTEIPEKVWDLSKETLLVLDDQVMSLNDDHVELYVKKARHARVTPMLLSQFVFDSKHLMKILANSSMIFMMGSKNMLESVRNLGRKSGETKFLEDAFKQILKEPFGYLVKINDPKVTEILRLRTSIFRQESSEPATVFLPKQ